MLLNEITNVVNIASRLKHAKDKADGSGEQEVDIPDTIGAPDSDEVSNKRRAKMKPSDQLRDVAKQLGNKLK